MRKIRKYGLCGFLLLFFHSASAQCAIEHWSLAKRVEQSQLVVEGRVVSQRCSWDGAEQNIYTIHTVEVYRTFKGASLPQTIELVTMGGAVDDEMHVAYPSLQLESGETGIFLLRSSALIFNDQQDRYEPTASIESLITYDLVNVRAYDVEQQFHSISNDLYGLIAELCGREPVVIKEFDPEAARKGVRQTATPVISGLSMDTVSAGTGSILTITGTNFGLARGTNGIVGFKDANYGDGRYHYLGLDFSYVSWSNSQIRVRVPTRAGTGKVQVINNLQQSGESATDVLVKWSHLNVTYAPSAGDTAYFGTNHINSNGDGGYTWNMTNDFAANQPAVQAMYRSLETWRCGTLMNWKVGADTSLDQTASDQVNIVRFDDLAGNRLGTCWSRYSGCYNPSLDTFIWFVRELDIEFDSTYTWYYGEGTTPGGSYDFQSVATHELGHGHQLGHVRDDQKIMHYSIGPGQKKDDLHAFDVEGGAHVHNQSTSTGSCSNPAMQALDPSDCNITLPKVQYSVSDTVSCLGDSILFTSTTEGNNLSYLWDFGANAIPATSTASSVWVRHSSWGRSGFKLVVQNGFGSDSITDSVMVLPPIPEQPLNFAEGDTNCQGINSYTVAEVDYAETYVWAISGGGSIQGSAQGKTLKVDWTSTGNKVITTVAIGACGNSPPQRDTVYILGNALADFVPSIDGLSVDFSFSGDHAASWSWDFGDGTTDSVEAPSHDFPDKGIYNVTVIVENQCNKDTFSSQLTLDFRAGIDEFTAGLSVYPNPVRAGGMVRFSQPVHGIELVDAFGKRVWASDLNSDLYRLPELSAGPYVLTIRWNDTQYRQKLFLRE